MESITMEMNEAQKVVDYCEYLKHQVSELTRELASLRAKSEKKAKAKASKQAEIVKDSASIEAEIKRKNDLIGSQKYIGYKVSGKFVLLQTQYGYSVFEWSADSGKLVWNNKFKVSKTTGKIVEKKD